MTRNYYKSGEWNVICDVCSRKIKSGEARLRWDGFVVCAKDYETRHPQDFVKSKVDKIVVPFTRPRPTDIFTYPLGIQDTAYISDNSDDLVYLATYNDYFTSDYIENLNAIQVDIIWNKLYQDSYIVSDTNRVTLNKSSLLDNVTITDNLQVVRRYIRALSDTITQEETITIVYADYVDATYFASNDYVNTTYVL